MNEPRKVPASTRAFRWTPAAERTAYVWEVREAALAHAKGDKVEAAYQRGDLFAKRRRLTNEWARFCENTKRIQPKKSSDRVIE